MVRTQHRYFKRSIKREVNDKIPEENLSKNYSIKIAGLNGLACLAFPFGS